MKTTVSDRPGNPPTFLLLGYHEVQLLRAMLTLAPERGLNEAMVNYLHDAGVTAQAAAELFQDLGLIDGDDNG